MEICTITNIKANITTIFHQYNTTNRKLQIDDSE